MFERREDGIGPERELNWRKMDLRLGRRAREAGRGPEKELDRRLIF
jgi:hypothetical protein